MNRASARDVKIPDFGSAGDTAVLELIDARPASVEEPLSASRAPLHLTARGIYVLWTLGLLVLFFLHFPHLLADFPNNSPWMDYSKYTDEGWYSNAAIVTTSQDTGICMATLIPPSRFLSGRC